VKFPESNYLSQAELAKWLDVDRSTLQRMVDAGILPDGIVRPFEKRPVWDADSAAACNWILKNRHRFKEPCQVQKTPENARKCEKTAENLTQEH
jgi:hypothetical protein